MATVRLIIEVEDDELDFYLADTVRECIPATMRAFSAVYGEANERSVSSDGKNAHGDRWRARAHVEDV